MVHAHPPVATGYATAGRQLNLALLPEVVIGLGCVPLAAYGLPGTDALTEPMLPLIPKYDALMMANHGAVCYGEDVFKAYFKMETMEHFARIQLVAELLGGPKVLPRTEVDKLLDSRTRYGVKAKSAGEPNCPVAAEEVGTAAVAARRRHCVARPGRTFLRIALGTRPDGGRRSQGARDSIEQILWRLNRWVKL